MKSIRSRIMWSLFACVLVASFLIGSTGILLTTDIIQKTTKENMRLLCRNNADKIDMTFAKIEESVNTLAHFAEEELEGCENLKEETYRKDFSQELQKNALHHIESIAGAAAVYMLYDPAYIGLTDGFFYVKETDHEKESFRYHPLQETVGNDGESNWWYVPTASGEATWFEAYYDTNLERYVVSYVVPLYKDGLLFAVIGADVFTERIVNQVKEVSIFSSGQGAVLKSDGTVLYHPNFDRGSLLGEGDPGFEGVIEQLTKEDAPEDLISYRLNGEKKKLASCQLRNGMLMICFAPESEIYARQTLFILVSLGITLGVILLSFLLAYFLSRSLTRPIKTLGEAAKHLQKGRFDFSVQKSSLEEINELSETFAQARDLLKKQFHLLDAEAHRDGLTGVGNKSAFLDLEKEINGDIQQGKAEFSVLVFDVNKLKVANDVFGHMAGDQLLLTVATKLSEDFGAKHVFRMGGDEFVVISKDPEVQHKAIACQEALPSLSVENFPELTVSCACGFSRFQKETDHALSDVLLRADREMYKNKAKTKKEELS